MGAGKAVKRPAPKEGASIEPISPSQARTLRRRILRPAQPPEASVYPLDEEEATLHLGAFREGEMVGTASIFRESPPGTEDADSWRIRGMATLPDVRGKGFGGRLLEGLVAHARRRGGTEIWCNARTTAAGFYGRYGFEARDEPFDLPPIGPHLRMFLTLPSA
jgi:GNAT superfamily N-acetyltransferase